MPGCCPTGCRAAPPISPAASRWPRPRRRSRPRRAPPPSSARSITPGAGAACPAVAWMVERLAAGVDAHPLGTAAGRAAAAHRGGRAGAVPRRCGACHGPDPRPGRDPGDRGRHRRRRRAGARRRGGGCRRLARHRGCAFVRRFSLEATDTMFPGADPVAGRWPSGSRTSWPSCAGSTPTCRGRRISGSDRRAAGRGTIFAAPRDELSRSFAA